MRLDTGLPEVLSQADIVLISGMNAMQDEQTLAIRLEELRSALSALPGGAFVAFFGPTVPSSFLMSLAGPSLPSGRIGNTATDPPK